MKKTSARIVNFFSMLVVVFKRLRHNLGLTTSALVGSISILALVVCVPVFSNAVSSEVLRQQLLEKVKTTNRGLFSIHTYFLDTTTPSVMNIANVDQVTQFINRRFPS